MPARCRPEEKAWRRSYDHAHEDVDSRTITHFSEQFVFQTDRLQSRLVQLDRALCSYVKGSVFDPRRLVS